MQTTSTLSQKQWVIIIIGSQSLSHQKILPLANNIEDSTLQIPTSYWIFFWLWSSFDPVESIGVGQECQGEPNLGVWSLNWGDMETLLAPPIVNTYVPGGRGCKSMSIACSITTSNSTLSQAGWHPLILMGTRATGYGFKSASSLKVISIRSYIAKNQSSDLIFRPQLLFPPVKSS